MGWIVRRAKVPADAGAEDLVRKEGLRRIVESTICRAGEGGGEGEGKGEEQERTRVGERVSPCGRRKRFDEK
jgi:hypothetical protein